MKLEGNESLWEEGSKALKMFQNGKFAMFIHWGLYSILANNYHNQTYYGIGEWIMRPQMADIPIQDYMQYAASFYPNKFNASLIVQLAKEAGMKYIVMTAKHHDGFAMYHSQFGNFGVAQTRWDVVDPIREVSAMARDQGLGFGIYYSHYQDWTFPGGAGGPSVDPETGLAATFQDYFERKCLPQVKELTTQYGELDVVWFDTPGAILQVHVEQLVQVVRENQPGALISGRVGYDLGDYTTLGDMEIPERVVDVSTGLWESVDTTNDSWGFASYDQNWKTPRQVLIRLMSCIARGGTYMLNIGPKGDGEIPERAAFSLRIVGAWIRKYARVAYGAEASPWEHGFPWGDVTRKGNYLFLLVFEWPVRGKIYLPGLKSEVASVSFAKGLQECNLEDDKAKLVFEMNEDGMILQVPSHPPDNLISVIEVLLHNATAVADSTWIIDPSMHTEISSEFAIVQGGAEKSKHRWMEKFGEWKSAVRVHQFLNNTSKAVWEVIVLTPGYYAVDLTYSSKGRIQWQVTVTGLESIKNEQSSSHNYQLFSIGWIHFPRKGKFSISVHCLSVGQTLESANLKSIHFSPVFVD